MQSAYPFAGQCRLDFDADQGAVWSTCLENRGCPGDEESNDSGAALSCDPVRELTIYGSALDEELLVVRASAG